MAPTAIPHPDTPQPKSEPQAQVPRWDGGQSLPHSKSTCCCLQELQEGAHAELSNGGDGEEQECEACHYMGHQAARGGRKIRGQKVFLQGPHSPTLPGAHAAIPTLLYGHWGRTKTSHLEWKVTLMPILALGGFGGTSPSPPSSQSKFHTPIFQQQSQSPASHTLQEPVLNSYMHKYIYIYIFFKGSRLPACRKEACFIPLANTGMNPASPGRHQCAPALWHLEQAPLTFFSSLFLSQPQGSDELIT